MLRILLISLAALATGCASILPVYHPSHLFAEGWGTEKINTDTYRVVHRGGTDTSQRRVESALLIAAAETAATAGRSHFTVVEAPVEQTPPNMTPFFGTTEDGTAYPYYAFKYGWAADLAFLPRPGDPEEPVAALFMTLADSPGPDAINARRVLDPNDATSVKLRR